ncbi:unnamed protein product [Triticum turgidum subsp. durum]|uniref:Uncharacterized protein n=1 Tax=Triticum turgidum subsp. durum TaxID=4567 RepID=A0A9R0SM03_TRITD|nr:unnamed protein product [Triticum turgidum subsp. durum]
MKQRRWWVALGPCWSMSPARSSSRVCPDGSGNPWRWVHAGRRGAAWEVDKTCQMELRSVAVVHLYSHTLYMTLVLTASCTLAS